MKADTKRLTWWEKHSNFQHDTDPETGEFVISEITGGVNDRQWEEVARGMTLRSALNKAMKYKRKAKQI